VLDTATGVAARGVRIHVHRVHESGLERVADAVTNAHGRTDAPLMSGDRLETGVYQLTFEVGAYFSQAGVPLTSPPFLDEVVVRIGLADAAGDYHVPLLISPYGYSTYRGT
jgi:5-hydroxyisourate hydrolase